MELSTFSKDLESNLYPFGSAEHVHLQLGKPPVAVHARDLGLVTAERPLGHQHAVTLDDALGHLDHVGLDVCESVEPQILTGKRHLLTFSGVSDGRITIYEYDNSAQAQVDVYSIDDSGSEVVLENETHYVEWKSIPHFYLYNNLIIQYIGTDRDILNLLTNLCGNQFAGGDK